jgi:hypothetical protein
VPPPPLQSLPAPTHLRPAGGGPPLGGACGPRPGRRRRRLLTICQMKYPSQYLSQKEAVLAGLAGCRRRRPAARGARLVSAAPLLLSSAQLLCRDGCGPPGGWPFHRRQRRHRRQPPACAPEHRHRILYIIPRRPVPE